VKGADACEVAAEGQDLLRVDNIPDNQEIQQPAVMEGLHRLLIRRGQRQRGAPSRGAAATCGEKCQSEVSAHIEVVPAGNRRQAAGHLSRECTAASTTWLMKGGPGAETGRMHVRSMHVREKSPTDGVPLSKT
jgi:hypothetical protein